MSQVSAPPRTKRGKATRKKIMNAAATVFYEKGYNGGTIADITRVAGVGNGTFYIYFESKLSVYHQLLQEYNQRIRAHSSQAIQNCKSRKEAERIGIRCFFDFVLKDQSIFNIIWESLYIDRSFFDEFYTTFAQSYAAKLKEAQLTGEVRNIDPQVLSYALIGITNFVALNSIVLKQESNIDYLADEVMKLLEHGMFN